MRRIRTVHRLVIFGVAALAAWPAAAETLYKLTERDGSVTYANAIPHGFSGEVKRLDIDTRANVASGADRPADRLSANGAMASAPPDLLTQRRASRAALEANLERARDRLAQARAALDELLNPQGPEFQGVQRVTESDEPRPAPPAPPVEVERRPGFPQPAPAPGGDSGEAVQGRPGAGGMHGMAPLQNCRNVVTPGGATARVCGGAVPSAAYHERVAALEHEVRLAEEEVAAAETAYRRGVD